MIDAEPRFVLLISHMYLTFIVSLLFEHLLFMSASVALMLMTLMMRDVHSSGEASNKSKQYHYYLLISGFITFGLLVTTLYVNVC